MSLDKLDELRKTIPNKAATNRRSPSALGGWWPLTLEKKNMTRNISLLLVALITGGCNTQQQNLSTSPELILSPRSPQYQRMNYRRTASGFFVPAILTDSDVDKILKIVRHRTKENVTKVAILSGEIIRVETGEVRGPLNGSGDFFDFYKTGHRWELCGEGVWRH